MDRDGHITEEEPDAGRKESPRPTNSHGHEGDLRMLRGDKGARLEVAQRSGRRVDLARAFNEKNNIRARIEGFLCASERATGRVLIRAIDRYVPGEQQRGADARGVDQ